MVHRSNMQRLSMAIVCLLLLQTSAWAQAFGSVIGTVMDPKGDVIPGATLTLVNTATNLTRTATAS